VKHKRGKDNIVADALSRRCVLITQLDTKVLGLEPIKTLYDVDADFTEPFSRCIDGKGWDKYYVHDGCFGLTKYTFQLIRFDKFFCRKHMQVGSLDILVSRRHWTCSLIIYFGHICNVMSSDMFGAASFA
jgi:hypothetical protein